MSDTLTTALERSAQPKEAKTILDLIERQKPPTDRTMTAPRGCAYALAQVTGSTKPLFHVIYPEDVAKAQARSANAKHPSSPWQTDYFAMVRKTAVRRLAPFLPQSPTFARG